MARTRAADLFAATATVLLSLAVAATGSRCDGSKTSAYIGFKGPLVNTEHQIRGDIEIVDDCTFKITQFGYDGQAPATYWWCGETASTLTSGSAANDWLFTAANGYRTMLLELKDGLTWESCKVLSAWCKTVSADLGHVELQPPPAGTPPPPLPGRLPAAMTDTMVNCMELQPGKLNVYWTLDSADPATAKLAHVTLQGALGAGTEWMGYGFNDPSVNRVRMVGSDVVIAGLLPSLEPFVSDFYLGDRAQCDFRTAGEPGVCTDQHFTGTATSDNVKLLAADRRDGVTSVTFLRPVNAVDAEYDVDWPVSASRPLTWAYGPLSPTSTAAEPLPLYHGPSQHAGPGANMSLGATGFNCPTPIGSPSTGGGGTEVPLPSAAPSPQLGGGSTPAPAGGAAVKTLYGRTNIVVTQGTNPNYPNPPAWGLSYHLAGLETPVLTLLRGVTYTFSVRAGPTHPLYFTSDINGGRSNASEVVYGGSAASFGTATAPYTLDFTPSASTPSDLFYQCWRHQKLGWRIKVLDADDGSACSKTHPYVGFSGPLTTLDHGAAGTLTVIDDCTFTVTGFRYDGAAPDTYWYGSNTSDVASVKSGWPLGPEYTAGAVNGSGPVLTVRLSAGASWDKISAVSFYCKSFDAVLGLISLGPAPPSSSSPGPATTGGSSPAPAPSGGSGGGGPAPVPTGAAPPPPMRWCDDRSPYTGYMISLNAKEHGVSGVVTVVDSCTLRVSLLTYDGLAPDAYWMGADEDSDAAFAAGTLLAPYTGGAADGTGPDLYITLPRGVSLTSLRALSLYCKSMAVNMGSAPLGAKCASAGALVGFTAPLIGHEHVAYGTFRIIDDCTATVEDFIYDGLAPDAFWKVGPSADNFSDARGATTIAAYTNGAASRSTVVLRLPEGLGWATVRGVSFYCQSMSMSMAHTALPARPPSASHPAVGAFVPLLPVAHVTGGTLQVLDDTTAMIHDLRYDGSAPDIVIRLAMEDSTAAYMSNGTSYDVLEWKAGTAAAVKPMSIVFKLPAGQTWSSLRGVSVWCRSMAENMASAPVLNRCARSPAAAGSGAAYQSLTALEHVAPGAVVAVLDSCTIRVTGFTYDGAAPDLYWVGAPVDSVAAYNSSQAVMLQQWVAGAVKDATVYLRLPQGVGLESVGALSAWCASMAVNMASTPLLPACGRSDPRVGSSTPLTGYEHVAQGAAVYVVDDCTLRISGFTYDGLAPDAFWMAAASDSAAAYNTSSLVLSSMWRGGPITKGTIFVRLPAGVRLSQVAALSFFCRSMGVNMASAPLHVPCSSPTKPSRNPATFPPPSRRRHPAAAPPTSRRNAAAISSRNPTFPPPKLKIGRTFYFAAFDHVGRGASITVWDECTALVSGFTYDGLAPDAVWVAAPADSTAAYNASSSAAGALLATWTHGAVTGASLKLKLPAGTTWSSVRGISFFCKSMAVNMASVALP
ncbi:hypothetical protein HYH02_010639 [Chlamydomonas schloesseri]|uniref:DM13 domain-containing protein n=1 Tax=Chlamydomonas schloesseri TaxID=2026947 RepID=A0A835T6E2_9CHLO|nr:hypothetical protein HYH02_010639 [Chlamydomonas schloesseri]|eukprot:KAG2439762.1 hypothetical protein HYH02_010639 [Chlamydomonas schloesseri]